VALTIGVADRPEPTTGSATVAVALPPETSGSAATSPRNAAALAPTAAVRVARAAWRLPMRRGPSVIVLAAAVQLVVVAALAVVTALAVVVGCLVP